MLAESVLGQIEDQLGLLQECIDCLGVGIEDLDKATQMDIAALRLSLTNSISRYADCLRKQHV